MKMLSINMRNAVSKNISCWYSTTRQYAAQSTVKSQNGPKFSNEFETVFSLPTIKYFALINRLKIYQIVGTSVIVPICGILDFSDVISNHSVTTAYIGLTGIVALTLLTLPFRNIIGHLYISEDNRQIKISSVDFWGRRIDRIISTEDWMPLLEMKPKNMDAIYLTPQLTDGTKYKLLIKFGKVFNATKMGQVLE